jgi:hypothetical protein
MGARSDFDASVDGDTNTDHEEAISMANSAAPNSPNRYIDREAADNHIASYISEQLEKVKSYDSLVNEDEFEAQLDES